MLLWVKSRHLPLTVALALAAQLIVLVPGRRAIAVPALFGSGVDLPIATLVALPSATLAARFLSGMSAADDIAARNVWLWDRAAMLLMIAGLLVVGMALMPEGGTAGIASALTVSGLGWLGVACARIFGERFGAAAPAMYLLLCCAVGRHDGGSLFFWQFPLMTEADARAVACAAVLVVATCLIRVPDQLRATAR